MASPDSFFLIFLLTILAIRVFLYFKPLPAPTIKKFRAHHWMYGLALAAVSAIFKSLPLFAVGLALFVDELTFLLARGKNHTDNYSKISLMGTACFIVAIYFFRNVIIKIF